MRSLEIRTQRIFNNLIKQNQKLDSDSVLKESTTVPSVQCPEPSVQSVASNVQSPASRVQRPASRVQCPQSSVQSSESRVQCPVSNIQSPASKTCVQSPGIPVCQIILKKMTCLGFKTPVIKWFEPYLSHRKFFVSVVDFFSEAGILNCDISSGAYFGTTPVFNIY